MKKIVICTSTTDQVNNLVNILKNQYKVEVLDSSSKSYTVAYCSQFDLIIDFLNANENKKTNVIKQCSDAGIPVLCGGLSSRTTNVQYGAAVTLGLADYNDYYAGSRTFLITDRRDVLKQFAYSKFIVNGRCYTLGRKLAPDVEPISYGEPREYFTVINCAVFRKGRRNLKGEKFGSDCAFLGLPYDVETSDIMRDLTLEIVTWLLDINEFKGIVKDAGDNQEVRDVVLHLKDTGYRIDNVKSDARGQFTFRCHGRNNEYYAIALENENGSEKPVIFDKIKF